ncbi:MAG TPA: hypothetical protein VMI75_34805 [Polyangiaceae bacterium]|nr:hypothetical protein [Polyangiaceae bacterium]
MSEVPYRSEQVGVRIVNPRSTFWSRLRLSPKESADLFVVYVGVCLAAGLVAMWAIALLFWQSPAHGYGEAQERVVICVTILGSVLAIGVTSLEATSAFRIIRPERMLPREIHLFEDHVIVVPFVGTAFHIPWSEYVLGATAAPGGVRLLLCREPRLEFSVRRSALKAHEWALLRRWLEARDLGG